MEHKRVTLFAGHYGSGKTNIAVNYAFKLKKDGESVVIADLDIVNPYFRTKDSKEELDKNGIKLISSEFANTNVDFPALPQEMYEVTDNRSEFAVLDIGGDDRGAYALGRYAPSIKEENNYEMLLVINKYRPLTADAGSVAEIMREIELAGGIAFTGIVNNSNLGEETTAQTVLNSVEYSSEVSRITGLPVKMTSVQQSLYDELKDKIDNVFPLKLQHKITQEV